MMMVQRTCFLTTSFLFVLAVFKKINAEWLDDLSLKGPFSHVDSEGDRTLGKHWSIGRQKGTNDYDSTVHENFVRLTSETRSRNGMIWNEKKIASDTFIVVVDFRMSGSNKRWFGNGLALWMTQHPKHIYAENRYGFADKFVGVGVVLDAFSFGGHTAEDLHKDVTVMVNDGQSMAHDLLNAETRLGCNAALRYHEGHASFNSVYNTSRIKVQISSTKLTVEVDPKGVGSWTMCYDGQIDLPSGWLQSATFGITASTGSTASDNHDILSVNAFDSAEDIKKVQDLDSKMEIKMYGMGIEKWFDHEHCDTGCKITILKRQIHDITLNVEHSMTQLQEKTTLSVDSIKKMENQSHVKIDNLAVRVQETVDGRMDYRTDAMSRSMARKIEHTSRIKLKASISSWKTPFYILVVFVLAVVIYAYRTYYKFVQKSKFY